jgi:hypothetical protein
MKTVAASLWSLPYKRIRGQGRGGALGEIKKPPPSPLRRICIIHSLNSLFIKLFKTS